MGKTHMEGCGIVPKQYTFKTTRATEWMEKILDSIEPQDRSSFIREMLLVGMMNKGIPVGSLVSRIQINVSPTTDTQMSDVAHQTDEQQKTDDIPQPPIIEEVWELGKLIVDKYEEKYHLDCNLGELGGV